MTGCLNGGSCVSDETKQTFSCSCKAPWAGEKCELPPGKKHTVSICIMQLKVMPNSPKVDLDRLLCFRLKEMSCNTILALVVDIQRALD